MQVLKTQQPWQTNKQTKKSWHLSEQQPRRDVAAFCRPSFLIRWSGDEILGVFAVLLIAIIIYSLVLIMTVFLGIYKFLRLSCLQNLSGTVVPLHENADEIAHFNWICRGRGGGEEKQTGSIWGCLERALDAMLQSWTIKANLIEGLQGHLVSSTKFGQLARFFFFKQITGNKRTVARIFWTSPWHSRVPF